MLTRWAARILEGRGYAVIARKRIRWVNLNGKGAWVILDSRPPVAKPKHKTPVVHDVIGDEYSFVPSTDGTTALIYSNLTNVQPGDFLRLRHDDGTPVLYRVSNCDFQQSGIWRGELEYADHANI